MIMNGRQLLNEARDLLSTFDVNEPVEFMNQLLNRVRDLLVAAHPLVIKDPEAGVVFFQLEVVHNESLDKLRIRVEGGRRLDPDFPETVLSRKKESDQLLVHWWPINFPLEGRVDGFVLRTISPDLEIAAALGISRAELRKYRFENKTPWGKSAFNITDLIAEGRLPPNFSTTKATVASVLAPLRRRAGQPPHKMTVGPWGKEYEDQEGRKQLIDPTKRHLAFQEVANWVSSDCIGSVLRRLVELDIRPQIGSAADEEMLRSVLAERRVCPVAEAPMGRVLAERILGVSWTAKLSEIHRAYRRAECEFAPDLFDPEDQESAADNRYDFQRAFLGTLAARYTRIISKKGIGQRRGKSGERGEYVTFGAGNPTLSTILDLNHPLRPEEIIYIRQAVRLLLIESCRREFKKNNIEMTPRALADCAAEWMLKLAGAHEARGQFVL